MSRPPHARARILAASRELVLSGGVRNLTLGNLEVAGKVTRGGILYHWPNREALITELVTQDLNHWYQRCRDVQGDGDLVSAHARCAVSAEDGTGEVTAILLSELARYPALQAAVKWRFDGMFKNWAWDDVDLHRYVMLLAAEGVFWRRLHGLMPDVPELDSRVGEWIQRLLDGPTLPPPAPAQSNQGNVHVPA